MMMRTVVVVTMIMMKIGENVKKKKSGAGLKSVPGGPKHSNKKSRKIPGFQF